MSHTYPKPSHHQPIYRCIINKKVFPTLLPGPKVLRVSTLTAGENEHCSGSGQSATSMEEGSLGTSQEGYLFS